MKESGSDGRSPTSKNLHERFFGHQHLTIVEPPKAWRFIDLKELWAYRELFLTLTGRNLRIRYKQTALGAAWAVIQPLTAMLIFSLIFGRLAKMPSDGLPYPIFVYSGLLPWTFFANALGTCGGSLVASSALVSKVYFPRLLIPAAAVAAGLVDLAIASSILLVMMLLYGVGWTWNLVATPILFLGLVLTTFGVGSLLAALTVTYRDFRLLVPFLTQIWLFATPVIYPTGLVPADWRWLLWLNPMTGLVDGFRSAFLGRPFDESSLTVSFATGALVLAVGVVYFARAERRFADII